VYPGFTRSAVAEPLGDLGCSVAFSPERIDPGNRTHHLQNTPKLVGGADRNAGELAAEFYRSIVDEVHVVSSCEVAEAAKVLENTFRMVNIALANEMALICQRLEISANEVIDAAATKPFGFMPFRPGPGTGGHCIPVDPHYLSWKLRTLNYHSRLIDLASQINSQMPEHIVSLVSDALNGRRLPVSGSRILVLGLAYKPDIADTRESPAIDIVRLLRAKGALVEIADPHVSSLPPGMEAPSEILNPGRPVEDYDCVVVATDHSRFDWADICSRARLVVDARNALKSLRKYHPDKIVSL